MKFDLINREWLLRDVAAANADTPLNNTLDHAAFARTKTVKLTTVVKSAYGFAG